MFRRNNRATTTQVKHALSRGFTRQSNNFSVRIHKNSLEKVAISTFSVVVSKKVAPTAVARNTLKRRIRSALQQNRAPKFSGIYIIYAKKGATALTVSDMAKELSQLIST